MFSVFSDVSIVQLVFGVCIGASVSLAVTPFFMRLSNEKEAFVTKILCPVSKIRCKNGFLEKLSDTHQTFS